ncbi:polyketide cyclase [Caballeronia sp. AZ1_KS37]|uniref:polyketide cyclase n=1 Tax=Caballeronia sp. AZ1_KS37 TaxID=2921756 RepID=UPI002028B2EB|nr:polyketide cyclase [Caballeronia sp. AZ1_KS37]
MHTRTLTVTVDRDWRELYDAIWRPEVFPTWASGLAQSTLEDMGDHWRARGPAGEVTIRFTEHNAFGIMDHRVGLPDGGEVYVPLRVYQNGAGAEIALTLFRQPGMSDDTFAADADWVRRDLAALAARYGKR